MSPHTNLHGALVVGQFTGDRQQTVDWRVATSGGQERTLPCLLAPDFHSLQPVGFHSAQVGNIFLVSTRRFPANYGL
jgi:hypothetical protein